MIALTREGNWQEWAWAGPEYTALMADGREHYVRDVVCDDPSGRPLLRDELALVPADGAGVYKRMVVLDF